MNLGQVGPEPDRLLKLFLRLRHLPQDVIVFCHCLVRPRRVRIGRDQIVHRLLGEQSAGAAQVVKQVGIVWTSGQGRHEVGDGVRQLSGFHLCNAQSGYIVRLL